MNKPRLISPLLISAALFSVLGFGGSLQAFPPAPFYTLYGDVRDQYGLLLQAGAGTIVVYQGGKEALRQPLVSISGMDHNYQLRVRMDMLRVATASYSSAALVAGSAFTLGIEIGGVVYYPIEMTVTQTIGNPADRKRLDLTLGVDSDHDGLPDAWEESQLYQAGYLPGANGWDLSLIDRDGDLDHDGLSNFNEYLAGTYAGDSTSMLDLKIKEKLTDSARLEFYQIYGKSYTLQSSTDLKTWVSVPFSVSEASSVAQDSLVATTTGIVSIYAAAGTTSTYYRLNIR